VDEHCIAWLDFAVGGRPSRFFRLDADWERFNRFVAYVASLPSEARPSEREVRERIEGWLPRRAEWVGELMAAYRQGIERSDGESGGAATAGM
jgi:hypothetical protein